MFAVEISIANCDGNIDPREKMKKLLYKNRGFTLIEMVIVMAVIGILASFSIPFLSGTMTNMRLGGAAREIHSVLQQARLRAAKEQSSVIVDFDPDRDGTLAGNYIAFVDTDKDFTRDGTETIFYSNTLPNDVQIDSAIFGSGPVTYTCFNKNGFPSDDAMNIYNGSVILSNINYSRTVNLTGAGSTTIQ